LPALYRGNFILVFPKSDSGIFNRTDYGCPSSEFEELGRFSAVCRDSDSDLENVMRIDFYHLEKMSFEEAVPLVLEKAYERGNKVLVRLEGASASDSLNQVLWTYNPDSFIPHGVEKDGFPEEQPIFITHKKDFNPNGADILVVYNPKDVPEMAGFSRVLIFFNGMDEEALKDARFVWRNTRENNELHYWQKENGRWAEKI